MNKSEYWKNRREGNRGQGIEFDPVVKVTIKNPSYGVGTKAVNRKTARRKHVSRLFTKKGFMYGVRIGGKEYNIRQHLVRKAKNANN